MLIAINKQKAPSISSDQAFGLTGEDMRGRSGRSLTNVASYRLIDDMKRKDLTTSDSNVDFLVFNVLR